LSAPCEHSARARLSAQVLDVARLASGAQERGEQAGAALAARLAKVEAAQSRTDAGPARLPLPAQPWGQTAVFEVDLAGSAWGGAQCMHGPPVLDG